MARVVTQHSIVNLLAGVITVGLYSPMHITVTCAEMGAALDLPTATNFAEAKARLETKDPFLLPLRVQDQYPAQ